MILRETDESFIRQVSLHPSVWKHVSGTDTPQDFELPDGVYYTLFNHGIKAGFMVFLPEDGFTSVHIAVLPKHHGRWITQSAKEVIADYRAVHNDKVVAKVRHHRVYALAVKVGFKTVGKDAKYTYMEL